MCLPAQLTFAIRWEVLTRLGRPKFEVRRSSKTVRKYKWARGCCIILLCGGRGGGRGEDVIFFKIAPPIGYYGYTNLHRVSIGLGRGEGGGGREGRTSRDTVLDEECEICIVVLYVLYCYTKCTMYHAQTPIHVHTCMYMLLHVHATTCQYMYMPLHVHTYICRGAGRDGVAELVEGGDIRTNLQSLCSNSHTGQENLGDEGVHLQTFCTCHMKLQSTSCIQRVVMY